MTIKGGYAFFNRIYVRGWLLAAALGCVWLNAHAVNKNNIGRASQTSTGRSTTIGPVTNSTGSTIPISPTLGGWTQAGNYGVPPGASGTTMNLGANGQVYIAGTKYPFQAGYQEPWSSYVLPALGVVATAGCSLASGGVATAACLTIPVALPLVYEWITRAGGRINPETGALERKDPSVCTDAFCTEYMIFPTRVGWKLQRSEACPAGFKGNTDGETLGGTFTFILDGVQAGSTPSCAYRLWQGWNADTSKPPFVSQTLGFSTRTVGGTPGGSWLPSSMDDIAPYMRNVNPDPRVWGELIDKGAEMPLPNPTVSGPSQIQGPERSTTNSDGSRTVERTTYNFQTAGNTINNTSNVTTTTTYNTDNSVRSTSSTTTTPTAEEVEKEDECAKRPNSVGCADLDTPTGEIPRETKTITYAEESVFGGGSCPSDKQWSSGTLGGSYKLVDWTTLCGYALPARALVILLAIFAAFLIVMPGKEVRT